MKTFRRLRKAYGRFAKRNRKPLMRANKLALRTVWKAIGAIRTGMNVERKFWDRLSLVMTTNLTSANPIMLALPWDGLSKSLDASGRVGDQIKALYTTYRARFDFAPTGLSDSATAVIRIICVLDTEPRLGSSLSAATLRDSILQHVATGPLQVTSPYKVTAGGSATGGGYVGQRYKILRDFRFTLDNVAQKQKMIKININHMLNKYRGFRVKYSDDPALADVPSDNRLYIFACTDHPTSGDITIDGDSSRVCFVDN